MRNSCCRTARWRRRAGGRLPRCIEWAARALAASHVDVGAERMFLDEIAARLDHVAHQLGEDVVGLVDLLDLHLQQRTLLCIERGFPHLALFHPPTPFSTPPLHALPT